MDLVTHRSNNFIYKKRQSYLSYFGPLSLLMLLGLWAVLLVFAFGMLQWAGGSAVNVSGAPPTFWTDVYLSGSNFFTLGIGDVTPRATFARFLTVLETGTGFGFLAILISYLPTLYAAFSQREVNISLLDARAGSPPTAAELLRRHGRERVMGALDVYLRDWETWSAQLMESHLTYPFLCFFRSQHDNQSWLAAFTAILDVCALLIAYGEGDTKWQAQLTFATCRHAVADLSQVLRLKTHPSRHDRLPPEELPHVRGLLVDCGLPGCTDAGDIKLRELRDMYEPYLEALSKALLMPLPSWGVKTQPNRETTVWGRISAPVSGVPVSVQSQIADETEADHF